MISIEKAILADVCLGLPLGKIVFSAPDHLVLSTTINPPDTFLFRGEQLGLMKLLYDRGDGNIADAVAELATAADEAINAGPFSVTHKRKLYFSPDPHDYQSLAKYWWPNPNTENGLPYVVKDGNINPECYTEDYDISRLVQFSDSVVLLALAAYFTEKRAYVECAVTLLETWFSDPETRQNPNFKFAQRVRGKEETTRHQSIVEARHLVYVTEAVQLLRSIGALSSDLVDSICTWFDELLSWLLNSEQGQKAKLSKNNVGFWYDLQCMVYAHFCGKPELAERIVQENISPRLKDQISPNGALPRELLRAKPLDYTAFTIAAMALISRSAEWNGLDLWSSEEGDGRSFQAAHDWLLRAGDAQHIQSKLRSTEATQYVDILLDMGIQLRALHCMAKTEKQKIQNLEIELSSEKAELRSVTKQRNELRSYVLRLEKNYQSIVNSRTWRMTGPIRMIVRSVKELFTNTLPEHSSLLKQPKALRNYLRRLRQTLEDDAGSRFKTLALHGRDALQHLLSARPKNEEALKKEYRDKGLDKEPDTFVLYRIIGNDLYPRHKKGQTRENLHFLLENEAEFPNCEKRWVVNRIVNPEEEQRIIALLDVHKQNYIRIPFITEEYRKIGWDFDALPSPGFLASKAWQELGPDQRLRARTALYRLKNNYLMNNNGARNEALCDGRKRAKWVLPWDGNCFITAKAWAEIKDDVISRPHLKYFAVPMARITDNDMLISDDFTPRPIEEPQLLFRRDSAEEFNPAVPYGRRPKVELFWRLGIPGPWDRWIDDPWEQKRRGESPEAGQFGVGGWVARMFSGMKDLESGARGSITNRGIVRQEAIVATIDDADRLVRGGHENQDGLVCYSTRSLDAVKNALGAGQDRSLKDLGNKIVADAEKVLGEGPYSVIDKTTQAPSGNPHDYWHPAPYWWPNPESADGLPYIKKDGMRVPGTNMYEPDSGRYDRTRLQLMFDGTTCLALSWYLTGRDEFAVHGAKLVSTWFLEPATRMNPHLRYSQVRRGRNKDEGSGTGIIELKDFYYFLDAVRLLEHSGAFTEDQSSALKDWLRQYLDWLESSYQGNNEVAATNNHGTYFDLQVAAITSYIGDRRKLRDILLRAHSRVAQQFTPTGEQPEEIKRAISRHYCFFNLQGWMNIFLLARANSFPLPNFANDPYCRLASALRWVSSHDQATWPYQQEAAFDKDRAFPLLHAGQRLGLAETHGLPRAYAVPDFLAVKPVFDPHDGIHPYWNICRPPRSS